ncbi:MAG: sialidase family protein [Anaerolineae bacterium]|nr:sialidase family protein [Anaerolineae bacterium]
MTKPDITRLTAAIFVFSAALAAVLVAASAAPSSGDSWWKDTFADATGLDILTNTVVANGSLMLAQETVTWTQTTAADFAAGTFSGTRVITAEDAIELAMAGFSAPTRVYSPTQPVAQKSPDLARDSAGGIHLVWQDVLASNKWEILYTRSSDGGITWAAPQELPHPSTAYRYPARIAAASPTELHAVWRESQEGETGDSIFYARSTNGGASWTLTTLASFGHAGNKTPAIARSASGGVHVVWARDYAGVFYANNANWGAVARISDVDAVQFSDAPHIVAGAANTVYAIWADTRAGTWNVYVDRSTDGGARWGMDVCINGVTGGQDAPSLAVASDGTVIAAWRGNRNQPTGGYDILVSRSTNGGSSWSAPTLILSPQTTTDQHNPVLAACGSFVHLLCRQNDGGKLNLFHAYSTDSGLTWSALAPADPGGAGIEHGPAAAVAEPSGRVYMAWEDRRESSGLIYTSCYDPNYVQQGVYLSPVWDTSGVTAWGTLAWDAVVPAGTSLSFQVRSGNTPAPDASWSNWSAPLVASGLPIPAPAGRFVQVRANLSTTDHSVSPRVHEMRLSYRRYKPAGAAVSVLIAPSPLGQWGQLTYTATVPAGSALHVDVCDASGAPLLTDVASGASLLGLSVQAYPALRLSARLESPGGSASPALDAWAVSWQADAPTPTATPSANPTATPSATPSATPTATSTEMPTPTPTPTPKLTPKITPIPHGRIFLPIVVRNAAR